MNRLYIAFLLMLSIWFTACNKKDVTETYLLEYIQDADNGLIKETERNGYKIKVLFKPTDLLLTQHTNNEPIDEDELRLLQANYSNYHYFILSLSRDKKNALYNMQKGYDEFSEMLQTLSFRMDQHVELTTSTRDTIPVADFIYPRLYGSAPSTDVLFVFNNEKAREAEWVQFNIKEFGLGVGSHRFRFNTRDIINTPNIKFQVLEKDKIQVL